MPAAVPTRVNFGPVAIDRDMAVWIWERAKALEVPRSYIVRQAIRAAMRAEKQRQGKAS